MSAGVSLVSGNPADSLPTLGGNGTAPAMQAGTVVPVAGKFTLNKMLTTPGGTGKGRPGGETKPVE
jgi:hypothetical protein